MRFIGFVPLGKRLQVERLTEEEATEGGVIRPQIAQQQMDICRVISVGYEVTDIRPGEYIQARRYAGSDQTILGKQTVVLDYEEVMGIYQVAPESELVTCSDGPNYGHDPN